ncbi:MAG: nickel-dependent hydrogenase large subunit [Euryarchaeota archaeon]|nr:nickel-dependent hydrogenase large subunit [Euryarchaeota archaeon]
MASPQIITIDPMTRIEGALAINVKVEDGKVTDAWSTAMMYRGVEQILLGRDPRDAPVITARVCGVCHNVHRTASTRAIENAFGITNEIPKGAIMLRNLQAAIEIVYDHALHVVALAGPDYSYDVLRNDGVDMSGWPSKYIETVKAFNFLTGKIYKEAVFHQRTMMTCLALLGGRAVFDHTWAPGGVGQAITVKLAGQIMTRVLSVQQWVDSTLVPAVANLEEIMIKYVGANTFGKGLNNFIAYGWLDALGETGKLIVPGGVYHAGSDYLVDQKNVGETIARSWYNPDMGNEKTAVYIGEEATPHPNVKSIGLNSPIPTPEYPKYSWAKGVRYNLAENWVPLEVGPLARLVINRKMYKNPFDLRVDENGKPSDTAANTLSRFMARVQETLWFIGAPSFGVEGVLLRWIGELDPSLPTALPKSPNIMKDGTYKGVGLWEAPRGALGHWVTVKDKKISLYNIIAATSWNAAPRDHLDQKGPIESALIGVPVPNDAKGNPILTNIGRTVRSFDPCLACTVHVFDADNKKRYQIQIR